MKRLLILLAAVSLASAQSSVSCVASQVSAYSSEQNSNAGGKGTCRVGKDPDMYRMLIRVTLGTAVPKMPCTLICKQYAYTSGGVDYDWPSFETVIASVPGTWVNGTAVEVPQEGSVCHKSRAYSATTPTPWVQGASASTILSVINGQGGSHSNSVPLDVQTAASGFNCTAVLDEQLLSDLISGGYGGLCISRAPAGGGEMRMRNSGIYLRWDPNGTTVSAEKLPVVGSSLRLSASPNPFATTTTIRTGAAADLSVRVFGITGALLNTLESRNGRAVWNGADIRGQRLPNGVYVIKTGNGPETRTERLSILR